MRTSERRSLPVWKKLILAVLSVAVLALQLAVFFLMVYYSYDFTTGLTIGYLIIEGIALIIVLTILKRDINANYKITWTVLILFLPIIFGLFYLSNITSRHFSKRKRYKMHEGFKNIPLDDVREELMSYDSKYYNMSSMVSRLTFSPVLKNSEFTFFADIAEKDRDLIENLKKAEKYIFLEYFIIAPGKLTDEIYEVLKERGEAGVQIKILYDDIGCRGHNNKKILKRLAKIKNCEVVSYQPLGFNFNILVNYRNHRKLAVIDMNIAYCGGDNLADEYAHLKERYGYWRDNCGKYVGQAATAFGAQFVEMWYASTKVMLDINVNSLNITRCEGNAYIMPFTDGPHYIGNATYDLFTSMIMGAKKSVYISTPYFIIDDAMLNMIALKCRQGVDVKILMPHIPDKKSPFYMARDHYGLIIRSGGEIYEMTKGFNHAKNIIIDGEAAYIGTANMDYRSLYLHFECGALVMKSPEIEKMNKDFLDTVDESEFITYEKWKKRPFISKIISFILNLFSPMF